ncbi:hypothetical protein PTTW11_10268 [Pyrenophora teres f. teres]|uniref:Uncharacterized protein n=1 Tax=Pyrenophora teres f. teres TaxID=97479 RepID=A0A6S6WD70_9PLEO|nr:hypothetical protein PTTW11_10268 [Pyrenophora teres f. teres]
METALPPASTLSTREIDAYRETAQVAILITNYVDAKIRRIRARQPLLISYIQLYSGSPTNDAWQEIDALYEKRGPFQARIEHCIAIIAPAECRALCQLVRDKLPTEIRDIVYRYLSVGRVNVIRKRFSCLEGQTCTWPFSIHVSDPEPPHSPDRIWEDCGESHLTDVDFMGEEIRNELLSYWLKNSIFCVGFNYWMLDNLFNTFISELGCYQRDLISNIEIAILPGKPSIGSSYESVYGPSQEFQIISTGRHLESLARMKPRSSLHMNNYLWLICNPKPFEVLTDLKGLLEDHWPYLWAMRKPQLVLHYSDRHGFCTLKARGGNSVEHWIEKFREAINIKATFISDQIEDAEESNVLEIEEDK